MIACLFVISSCSVEDENFVEDYSMQDSNLQLNPKTTKSALNYQPRYDRPPANPPTAPSGNGPSLFQKLFDECIEQCESIYGDAETLCGGDPACIRRENRAKAQCRRECYKLLD